jgi:hypothetical protein
MIASTVDPSNEENWSVVAGGAVDVIVTAMDEEKNQSTECNIPGRFSSQRNRIQSSPNTFTHESLRATKTQTIAGKADRFCRQEQRTNSQNQPEAKGNEIIWWIVMGIRLSK